MSTMLIALAAMFMQQTFASVGKTLPAVVAPLGRHGWRRLERLPP